MGGGWVKSHRHHLFVFFPSFLVSISCRGQLSLDSLVQWPSRKGGYCKRKERRVGEGDKQVSQFHRRRIQQKLKLEILFNNSEKKKSFIGPSAFLLLPKYVILKKRLQNTPPLRHTCLPADYSHGVQQTKQGWPIFSTAIVCVFKFIKTVKTNYKYSKNLLCFRLCPLFSYTSFGVNYVF